MPRVVSSLLPLVAVASLASLGSVGCASSGAVKPAREGRFPEARAAVNSEIQAGTMGPRAAALVARAIVKGEVERAQGDEGLARLRELSACAKQVDDALSSRSKKRDYLGAMSAILLIDAGVESPRGWSSWLDTPLDAPEAPFRALGARSLRSGGDGDQRRKLFLDGDEEVRRGAMRAAADAADEDDAEGLLEAGRLDPMPAARGQAVRSAGVIGGERVVLALKDLWPQGDVSLREAIVEAWSQGRSYEAGGAAQLHWVIDSERGRPQIAAALVVLDKDDSSTGALGVLERAVHEGATSERVHAIEVVPLENKTLREAVLKAQDDPDEVVAVAATGRLLDAKEKHGGLPDGERAARFEKLMALASGTTAGSGPAKLVLARFRAPGVEPLLLKDAEATEPRVRAEAGAALAAYGNLPRAVAIAADPIPRVRTSVSCAVLKAYDDR